MSDKKPEVQAIFYSGYKGSETVRAIRIGAHEYPVEKVLSRKRLQDKKSGERSELFRCRIAGKEIALEISPTGECRILGPGLDPPSSHK
jgi:hypothetical protein